MVLGGTFNAPSYLYTPLTSPDPFYYSSTPIFLLIFSVNLLDIEVDGTSIGVSTNVYNGNPQSPSIVDSGTTLVIMPTPAMDALKDRFTY